MIFSYTLELMVPFLYGPATLDEMVPMLLAFDIYSFFGIVDNIPDK